MPEEVNPDRACDLCRERRVKCDKRKPGCARCDKLGRPCPGYAKKRKFVDEGATLRKKFENRDHTTPPITYSVDDTSAAKTFSNGSKAQPEEGKEPWRNVLPRALREPYSPPAEQEFGLPPGEMVPMSADIFAEPVADTSLSGLDNLTEDIVFDPEWFDLDPTEFYNKAGNSCGFLPLAPTIVDEVDRAGNMMTMSTTPDNLDIWAEASQLHTSHLISDQREHEMTYLTRHFCETVGPWMDLYDVEQHFAHLVPLKALRDVLLRNAIAAVAAKQLGCMGGTKAVAPQYQPSARMEVMDGHIDWFYKAANYYDKAIGYSRMYLQALSGRMSAPPSPSLADSLPAADSDDLMLAISIFSLYEYLDNADLGWIQHLTGLNTIMSVLKPPVSRSLDSSASGLGRRASFWNFARADYQASFINKTATLLDVEDMPLWHEAGLQIQAQGALYAEDYSHERSTLSSTNELMARTLLWILLRIMNSLAGEGDEAVWRQLSLSLDQWISALPKSFQPCAHLPHPILRNVTEVFYSIPLCAATVQLYHFARLLLLQHRPVEINSDMQVTKAEMSSHAYSIIGIALGRPTTAVRVEMLLPLSVAGSCLSADAERRVVVDLLNAIQKDTGCETGGRVKELATRWGWNAKQAAVI